MNKVKFPTYQWWRSLRGDTRHVKSRNSSYLICPDTRENCPLLSKRQKCPWSGRYVPRCPTRNIRVLFPGANYLVVLLLLIVRMGLGVSLDGRPEWIPLLPEGEEIVAELFESGEVLQMYHLQATARLYEQGGLNHDLSFVLTAVAFSSLERPDTQVSMAYHPTNMTISLLPTISEDGRELRWEHQAASASYTNNLDQNYWTGTSYMGETTGAFFSYAVEFSLDYHRENPRYQPFSVYDDYPGHEFLVGSSCDEFVWALLAKAQELGVRLIPSLMPKKHKIIIYSQTEPELIILDGGGDRGGRREDSSAADYDGDNNIRDSSAGSRTPSSWRSSSSVSNGDGEGGRDRGLRLGVEHPSRRSLTTTASGATGSPALEEGDEGFGVTSVATMMPSSPGGGSDGSGAENMSTQAMVEVINSTWEGGSDGGGLPAVAADGEGGLETPEPTVSPVTSDKASEEDDWQQVVAYYQSVQLCLQERQFSFVQSLEDFAESFDCLDNVAFISIGPREYYKVNLTSSKVDHVSLAEDLPEVQRTRNGFALVDCLLVIWIVLILACGLHGMLWQGGVMQHWLKTSGYTQVNSNSNLEDVLPDRQPSLTRKISWMYLRFSKRFLSKSQGEAHRGVPDYVGVTSVGEGGEVTTVEESEVAGSPVDGSSSPTKMESEFSIVNGADGSGSERTRKGGFRANGRRGKRWENWGRDRFDQDSLDVEVGSEDVESGWSGRSCGRQQQSVRHDRGAVGDNGDKTADIANTEGVGGGARFDEDSEGVEMGSAASWRRAHGGGVDGGVDALEGSGNGVNATGFHGRRHLYSSPSREWSSAAVAWGTNYNDGGRDLWIRFPDSPSQPQPQPQSKPVEGVRVSQEDGADGGERFPQKERQEEGHRDRGPRIGPVSSLTVKDNLQSGAVDVRGVSTISEGPIGSSRRENEIGGASVVVEEEKLD